MIKNYFITAFRNIVKFRFHSAINFIGIAIGMAASLMIFIWIKYEIGFDKFHKQIDNIYQVSLIWHTQNRELETFDTNYALAPVLKDKFADVVESSSYEQIRMRIKITSSEELKTFYEDDLIFTTPSLFKIFNFPVLTGDYEKQLLAPNVVFLTKHIALKYFGSLDVIGKSISMGSADYPDANYTIGGVLEDCPENSSIKFNIVASYKTLDGLFQRFVDNWHGEYGDTYIKLRDGVNVKEFNKRISDYYQTLQQPGVIKSLKVHPFKKIHLFTPRGSGNIQSILIFVMIALFILASACINYINMSVVQSISRMKEIGVRKVNGAGKMQIIKQFITESFLLSFIAILLALLLIRIFMPVFNELTGINFNILYRLDVYFYLFIIALITSIGAGSYPAFYLSSVNVIKSFNNTTASKSTLRMFLVVVQFITSIVLIISSVIVTQQLSYIKNKDLGINTKNVIAFPMLGDRRNYDYFKAQLLKEEGVITVTSAFFLPNNIDLSDNQVEIYGRSDIQNVNVNFNCVNYDYIETMGIKLEQGRAFSKEYASDERSAILNRKAVEMLNLKNPIGQRFRVWGWYEGTIIGVSDNYHFESLKNNIKPIFLVKGIDIQFDNILIKISPNNIPQTIKNIEGVWKKLNPEYPFVYSFIDQKFEEMYKSEQKMGKIFSYFTFIAIIISCLGLFGLASLLSVQRAKEVGIRKVLGATVGQITTIMTMRFVKWVIIANILAIPIAYYFMNKWLQSFYYKISISIWVFIIAIVVSISIAVISVIFHTLRSANVNPVNVLSQE